MTTDVTVPASGESVTTANVARWHKKTGDAVSPGEVLVTLETDKVSNELEAEADGVLTILSAVGSEVGIGVVIGRIGWRRVRLWISPAPIRRTFHLNTLGVVEPFALR